MAVFYVALAHAEFIEANPGFQDLPCPAEAGLRLDERCLSCGTATRNREVFVSGSRMGRERQEYQQPLYLCETCLEARVQSRRDRRARRMARAGIALVLATLLSLGMRAMEFAEITAIAAWLLAAMAFYAASALVFRLRASGPWQEVDVIWFKDPRKGEDAEFLCVRIDNPEEAARFAALNPHVIPQARWDASYENPHDEPGIDREV